MNNKKILVFLMSIILVLSACIKKDNLSEENGMRESIDIGRRGKNFINDNSSEEEDVKELSDITDKYYKNVSYTKRKDFLIESIKKVPYPDEPTYFAVDTLKRTESFLELEKYSDELLEYALYLFQDEILTSDEKKIVAYVLINTNFNKYKYFLLDLAPLFVEEKIDEYLGRFCFFPGTVGNRASSNLYDPVIREALEIYIKSDKITDETRASIINDLNETQSEMSTN